MNFQSINPAEVAKFLISSSSKSSCQKKIFAKKILNKLLAKCIIQMFMPNLYSFWYMFIYKCILEYKKH